MCRCVFIVRASDAVAIFQYVTLNAINANTCTIAAAHATHIVDVSSLCNASSTRYCTDNDMLLSLPKNVNTNAIAVMARTTDSIVFNDVRSIGAAPLNASTSAVFQKTYFHMIAKRGVNPMSMGTRLLLVIATKTITKTRSEMTKMGNEGMMSHCV